MAPANPLLFYMLASILIIAALAVVKARNIFNAALSLGIVFFAVAGFYVTLQAEFIAGMQILVYVGAIIILILFAIMLTQGIHRREKTSSPQGMVIAAVVFLAIVAGFIIMWHHSPAPPVSTAHLPDGAEATTLLIGTSLVKDYTLPFELLSVLLLAALVGAIAITKKEENEADDRP